MRYFLFPLLTLLGLVSISLNRTYAAALQDSTAATKSDSVLDQRLNQIKKLSADRLADSLKRDSLNRQVALLSNADNIKKLALLKELAVLKAQDSLKLIRQRHQVDSLRHVLKGFPLVYNHDTLFYIYARQGSFTASERVDAINLRLHKLGELYSFHPDSLKLQNEEQSTDIVYQRQLLISVSDLDALWLNTSRVKLAAGYAAIIRKAVIKYHQENSWQALLREAVIALLIIAMAALVIYLINRSFKWILVKLRSQPGRLSKGIKIKNYELVNAEQQYQVVATVLTLLRWVFILLAVSLALPAVFSIFPFTREISATLIGYITAPLKKIGIAVWNYIPNLITILILVIVFRYVLRFFKFIKTEIERERLAIPGFYPDWANPTYQILRVLILLFMLIVIYPYLPGSDSPVFKGVSVFAGVLFTFGSAGALSNIVAGLVLTYMRAFKLGDRVKINDVTGDVIEKSLLTTRICTIQNEMISIPNSMVMNNYTVNYSSKVQDDGLIVNTIVTIGYEVNWRQVHELLIASALATPLIEADPKPYVFQTSLDDYYVSYRLNAYTKSPNKQAAIYSALHGNVLDKFHEAGIEVMSPHYRAVRDGSAAAAPGPYPAGDTTNK